MGRRSSLGGSLHRLGCHPVPTQGRLITAQGSERGASTEAPREHSPREQAHRRRVRFTTALTAVVYVPLAVGLALLSLEPPHVTPVWPMVALFIGGLAALVTYDRHPRLVFGGVMLLALLSLVWGSGAESVLAVAAVYIACVRTNGWLPWMWFGVALACGALGALALVLRARMGPPILGLAPPTMARDTVLDWANFSVIMAVVLLIAALLGMNVGHRRRYIGELVERAERLARERDQQAETARARERERIAREMHDVIAHSLSVMIAVSDGAHAAAETRPEEAKKAIARVAETGRKTLGEVRRLLGSVRGDEATEHAPQPDASQLTSLVAEFVAAGLPVRLDVTGMPSADPALGLTVYRIVQESLTNVLRHARQVTAVTVAVAWSPDGVTITVRDRGSAVARPMTTGRGMLGMQERVALYDGIIESGPSDDGGWRVFARLRGEDR